MRDGKSRDVFSFAIHLKINEITTICFFNSFEFTIHILSFNSIEFTDIILEVFMKKYKYLPRIIVYINNYKNIFFKFKNSMYTYVKKILFFCLYIVYNIHIFTILNLGLCIYISRYQYLIVRFGFKFDIKHHNLIQHISPYL